VLSLIRGLAAATVATALTFAAALGVGAAENGSPYVFVFGSVAAFVALTIPGDSKPGQALGASLGIGAALLVGAVDGFGLLVAAGVVGSVLAVAWTVGGSPTPVSVPESWIAPGVVLGLIVVVATVGVLVINGGTLGHDESAYALKARAWLEGTPETGWSIHRAPMLSLYAYSVLAAGLDEPMLRLIGLVAVVGLAGSVWVLGSKLAGGWVGPVAALAVVSGPAILRRGTEFLSDIPSAALLVVCMVILWREFVRKSEPTYHVLWLLVPALLAFYIRYQSVLSFALLAITVLIIWWPKVRSRPGPLVGLTTLGVVGLVPHFVYAISETGSPFGVLTRTGSASGRDFVGEGLVDYAVDIVWPLGGFVAPLAVLAAVVALVGFWKSSERRTTLLFLLLPAVGQVVVLGVFSHGEPRFIFFPLALLVVAGTMSLRALAQNGQLLSLKPALYGALATLLIGSLGLSLASARRSVDARIGSNEPIELASHEMINLSGGNTCGTMTSYLPQVTFYSACSTESFDEDLEAAVAVDDLVGEAKFMLLVEEGKRQPLGDELNDLVAEAEPEPALVDGVTRDAMLFEFTD
jgi:hypothetical protein